MGRPTNQQVNSSSNNAGPGDQLVIAQQQTDNSRIVMLHGTVTEESIATCIVQLLYLANQNRNPIHLVISTYGGSVDEMFSLYDTIKFLPCPVHTVALGKVMSAGVLLLAAGVKGKRLIGKSARIMIHPIWGGTEGNVFQQMTSAKEAVRMQNLMVDALKVETKMSPSEIKKVMNSGHDFYLTAYDAIKAGIVDKFAGE